MYSKQAVVKTGKDAKAFWEESGIAPAEYLDKLSYERLYIEENEPVIGVVKNAVRGALTPVYEKLAAYLSENGADEALVSRLDEMLDIVVENVGTLAFSATVQNEVVRINSGLPTPPEKEAAVQKADAMAFGSLDF